MKLKAEVDGRMHPVQIEQRGELFLATIEDQTYKFEIREITPDCLVLIHESEVFECLVTSEFGRQNHFQLHVRNRAFDVRLIDPKRMGTGETSGSPDHGRATVLAVMPGKVVRVLVEVGSRVEVGTGIAVVEAMKMQNEIKAPKAGSVVTLNAAPGATVNAGEVLAVIE